MTITSLVTLVPESKMVSHQPTTSTTIITLKQKKKKQLGKQQPQHRHHRSRWTRTQTLTILIWWIGIALSICLTVTIGLTFVSFLSDDSTATTTTTPMNDAIMMNLKSKNTHGEQEANRHHRSANQSSASQNMPPAPSHKSQRKQQLHENFEPNVGLQNDGKQQRQLPQSTHQLLLQPHQQPKQQEEESLIDMRELSYTLAFDNPDGGVWKQGWEVEAVTLPSNSSTTESTTNEKIQIFVVPHSHCDPGWIKTFDQYFRQQTSQILTTVMTSLLEDTSRTFIWAEMSYFAWWWEDQSAMMRQNVKELLQRKQLEFVTGGWVQPDEANSNFYAMKLQLEEGHEWIKTHLGVEFLPTSAWSIDPFGYSPTAAYLWKSYNMTSMLIQRVHYAVKKELAKRKHLEFYWRQTWDTTTMMTTKGNNVTTTTTVFPQTPNPHQHDIFTHVMPFFSYDIPHTCGPDPSVCCQFDFARMSSVGTGPTCPWHIPSTPITDRNIQSKARMLLDQYLKKNSLYRSKAVLAPLGDDFRWQTTKEARAQYTNYQTLFDYINTHFEGVEIKFGTLTQYFDTAKATFSGPVPVLKGSFFTYADVNEDYWSGYYTSRVFDKALDRQLERILSAAETTATSLGLDAGGPVAALQTARRALSLFQHHDGVAGTARNHVVEDYARRMHEAIYSVQTWMTTNIPELKGLQPCWVASAPRNVMENLCIAGEETVAYNPLEKVSQSCGINIIPPRSFGHVQLPCDGFSNISSSSSLFKFDPLTGLMVEPIREQWKVWKVSKGGAYLFFPDVMEEYDLVGHNVKIENGGINVFTPQWKRTIYDRTETSSVLDNAGTTGRAIVLDFVFETDLKDSNNEWLARFSSPIANEGYFHTDLNGFNFDTHRFRADLPIQSQVFPMPTLASIEDTKTRMTIISEHSQGTASLQDGSIDIWLDRRLAQDDRRGLGQGVTDNRRTRTTLRVVLEHDSFQPRPAEFDVTPLVRRMWDQIQHPLEIFGRYGNHTTNALNAIMEQKSVMDRRFVQEVVDTRKEERDMEREKRRIVSRKETAAERPVHTTTHSKDNIHVPFVIMAYKRLDYLKTAIQSIKESDFPRDRKALVVSVDGHVPEVLEYLYSLHQEFPHLIKLVHPFACHDHPNSFPGDDPQLNIGYKGDSYGNPRKAQITCCKHHFTWLLSTVFTIDALSDSDTFLFLEEDYVVAANIYSAIASGLNAVDDLNSPDILGLSLDASRGGMRKFPATNVNALSSQSWQVNSFVSGPMTMNRDAYRMLQQNAKEYCEYDDYNWDWSFVHVMSKKLLPFVVVEPFASMLAQHIGLKGGMHSHVHQLQDSQDLTAISGLLFEGVYIRGNIGHANPRGAKPNGGWGHPADQSHCIKLLSQPL